jgi:hypothetical protein
MNSSNHPCRRRRPPLSAHENRLRQLLPIYDKLMTVIRSQRHAGRPSRHPDHLNAEGSADVERFSRRWVTSGINPSYAEQPKPEGIAQAFRSAPTSLRCWRDAYPWGQHFYGKLTLEALANEQACTLVTMRDRAIWRRRI